VLYPCEEGGGSGSRGGTANTTAERCSEFCGLWRGEGCYQATVAPSCSVPFPEVPQLSRGQGKWPAGVAWPDLRRLKPRFFSRQSVLQAIAPFEASAGARCVRQLGVPEAGPGLVLVWRTAAPQCLRVTGLVIGAIQPGVRP
jgi:hypothetical protein